MCVWRAAIRDRSRAAEAHYPGAWAGDTGKALWILATSPAGRLALPALILVNLVALFWFKYANTTRPSPRSKWGKYPTSGRRRLAHAIPASHNFAGFCKMLACQLASCAISRARP
jgi:hypothetical protein